MGTVVHDSIYSIVGLVEGIQAALMVRLGSLATDVRFSISNVDSAGVDGSYIPLPTPGCHNRIYCPSVGFCLLKQTAESRMIP
jgi:hypothetical protein